MKSVWARTLCRLLVALLIWTPYQFASAGMIGTEQVVSSTAANADRATVLNFLNRSDVARELQSLGIDPASAKDRVAAMTDSEASQLADRINNLPAGADTGTVIAGILIIALIAVAVWYLWKRM